MTPLDKLLVEAEKLAWAFEAQGNVNDRELIRRLVACLKFAKERLEHFDEVLDGNGYPGTGGTLMGPTFEHLNNLSEGKEG